MTEARSATRCAPDPDGERRRRLEEHRRGALSDSIVKDLITAALWSTPEVGVPVALLWSHIQGSISEYRELSHV